MIAGIVAAALLAAVAAITPLLMQADVVQRVVKQRIAAAIGGDVRYESMSLKPLPRPRVEVRNLVINIPDVADGRVAAVDVRIALLPLLLGNVRPVSVRIEHPGFTVRLSPGGSTDPLEAYRAVAGPIAEYLTREAPELSVTIDGGSLDIVSAGQPPIALSGLQAEIEVSPDKVEADVAAASNYWRAARGRLRVSAGSLAASAKVTLEGLKSDELLAAMTGETSLAVRPGAVNVSLEAETNGRDRSRIAANLAMSELRLERASRSLDLGASKIAWEDLREGQAVTVSLRALQLGELVTSATGTLRMRRDGTQPALELQVPALDLGRVREAVLAIAGDVKAARAAAGMVATGGLRGLTLKVAGEDFAACSRLEAIAASAEVEAATIALSTTGIVVKDGSGRLSLDQGVLQGSGLSGAIGRSSFRSGSISVALAPAVKLSGLQAEVDADLADVLAIFRTLPGLRNNAVLANVTSLRGRAAGSFSYEALKKGAAVTVALARVQAAGRYRGMPFPLEVSRADLQYVGNRVRVRALSGRAGRSTLRNGTLDIAFGAAPVVRSAGGDARLVLDEIVPWLASLERLRPALNGVKSVTGAADVRLARLSGPLARPEALEFEAMVRPQAVRIEGFDLPADVTLSSGEGTVTARELRFGQLAGAMGDAQFTLAGTVQGYASAGRALDLSVSQGSFGQRSLDWAQERWKLPARAMPRAPVTIADMRVQWPGSGPLLLQGKTGFAGVVETNVDLSWQPGSVDLRRLQLRDADSDFTLALRWTPAAMDVFFNGRLDNRTLGRILAQPPAGGGAIRGDLRASADLREPLRSTATGKLEGEGVDLLERWGLPVVIDRFRAEVAVETLQLHESSVKLAGQAVGLSGTVQRAKGTFVIDARAVVDKLDVQRVLGALPRGDAARRPAGDGWNFPVEGKVAVTAASLTYGARVLQQVAAVTTLAPNRIATEVTEARLCGIALPFTAVLVPGRVEVSTRLKARGAELGRTVSCLAGEHLAVTGTYDLDAEFSAAGRGDALPQAARGNFHFTARAGRISRAEALDRTLALDEVAGRMEAAAAQAKKGAFDYDAIAAAGTLEGGRVRLEHITVDSPSLGITAAGEVGIADHSLSFQGLVAPLDQLSRVVRHVPVVGRVLGASLVVVPVSITGTVEDPKVRVLEAAAIGATLVNLMTTTLKAPIQLLDPLTGKLQR